MIFICLLNENQALRRVCNKGFRIIMQTFRTCQTRSGYKNAGGARREPESTFSSRQATFERLSTPKQKDRRWIPDRPSVYWLDYIIDPTPHKLKTPEELASYYDNFEPRFPRTRLLSAPRKYYGTLYRDEDATIRKPISETTGIPISALTYKASDRIKELARPKTTKVKEIFAEKKTSAGVAPKPTPSGTSKQSLLASRSRSPKGKARYFDPSVDLARGDYPSRSKHTIHAPSGKSSKDRIPHSETKSNIKTILSRSTSNYNNEYGGDVASRDVFRNDKKSSIGRTLYSIKR